MSLETDHIQDINPNWPTDLTHFSEEYLGLLHLRTELVPLAQAAGIEVPHLDSNLGPSPKPLIEELLKLQESGTNLLDLQVQIAKAAGETV